MRIFPIVFTLLCGAEQLCAQLEPDGANDTNYVSLGGQYVAKTVWVQAISPASTTVYASGILLDPYDVLVAAHFATSETLLSRVGNGSNALGSSGATSAVLNFVVNPNYNGTFSSPDIAVVHLSSPLGATILNLQPLSPGATLTLTGFGYHGTPSGGTFFDGGLRGWLGSVDNGNLPGNVSSSYYDNVDFYANSSPLPANALSGTSGAGVFDSVGNLVGMVDGQWGGTGSEGGTQFLEFAKSGVESWIATNLTPYIVFNTTGTNLVLQWNGSFILQSSTNLTGGFADITNAASPYINAMTAPQMYFRLRSAP